MYKFDQKRLRDFVARKAFLLVSALLLLGSVTLTAHAVLTVSNTGLSGDSNITVDGAGSLNLGTASATAITIGQSSLNVSIPGSLTVSSATTTLFNLHVTGSCLGCGLGGGITAINGLSNATMSLVAGTNVTIATSSPNIITVSASSGTTTPAGSNTQLQLNSAGLFGASPNLTWVSPALTIGQTGTTTGQIKFAGSATGTVTVQASSTAGTWNFTLPSSAGTAGYVLSTDGSGNTSWIAQSGGGGTNPPSTTNVLQGNGSGGFGTGYAVGYGANDLAQINSSAQLPAPNYQGVGLPYNDPAINNVGAPGGTFYAYCVTSTDAYSNTRTSCFNTATGNATLNGTNYNTITIAASSGSFPNVLPVGSCTVYRTAGGSTQGVIGTISSCASGGTLNDTGQTGDSTSPPTDTSGAIQVTGPIFFSGALNPFEMYDDESSLIIANPAGVQKWYTHDVIIGEGLSAGSFQNSGITSVGYASQGNAHACTAIGYGTTCNGQSAFVAGINAASNGGDISIGSGATSASSGDNAIGSGASASGGSSLALGKGATTAYTYSDAIGYNAVTTAFYQLVLGSTTIHDVYAGSVSGAANYHGNSYSFPCANASSGTVSNRLAKMTTSSQCTAAGTGDTDIPVYPVNVGNGNSGTAFLVQSGFATCQADAGGITALDWIVASASTGGECHDAGSTPPTGVWIVGQAQTTAAAGANATILVTGQLH
jgi:trimeric autotransporter adhesin